MPRLCSSFFWIFFNSFAYHVDVIAKLSHASHCDLFRNQIWKDLQMNVCQRVPSPKMYPLTIISWTNLKAYHPLQLLKCSDACLYILPCVQRFSLFVICNYLLLLLVKENENTSIYLQLQFLIRLLVNFTYLLIPNRSTLSFAKYLLSIAACQMRQSRFD